MSYYPFSTEIGARYKLVSPLGDTAIFNDPNDPNYVGMLTEITGLDSADVRESADELVEADGGTHGSFYMGRRPIVLSGRVFGHSTLVERAIRLDRAKNASMALRGDATLSWIPSLNARDENIITHPRAINDTTNWQTTGTGLSTGGTVSRVTGVDPPVGTTAIQIATSGSGSTNQGAAITANVLGGQVYAFSIAGRRTAGTATGSVYMGGAGFGSTANLGSISTSGWSVLSGTFVAPADGTVTFGLRSSQSNTVASTYQISDVMIRRGTNEGYIDGDTPGYWWQGSNGNSISGNYLEMFTTVRRQQPFRESGAWVKEFQIPLVSEYATIFSTQLHTKSDSGVSVENQGNYIAYPLLQITGISTNPSVTIDVPTGTDPVLRTTGLNLAAGETIEIDTLNHTARFIAGARNGQSGNRYIDFGATTIWPYIPKGQSTVSLAGGGSLTTIWRDTWA